MQNADCLPGETEKMDNLLLSFGVVAPLILYMAVGALLRKTGVMDEPSLRKANNIIFYVTLPLMCYRAIAASDLDAMLASFWDAGAARSPGAASPTVVSG